MDIQLYFSYPVSVKDKKHYFVTPGGGASKRVCLQKPVIYQYIHAIFTHPCALSTPVKIIGWDYGGDIQER